MKKILLIILLALTILVFGDFRTSGYRTARNPRGTYNFEAIVVESLDAEKAVIDSTIINDYLLVGDTTIDGASAMEIHKSPNRWENYRDTICFHSKWRAFGTWYKDAARIWVDDFEEQIDLTIECYGLGSGAIIFRTDECKPDTYDLIIFANSFYPGADTGANMGDCGLGLPTHRFRQANVRHYFSTDPGKGDSLHIHMEADTAYHESENPNKFDNDVFIDGEFETSGKILVGAGDSLTKFVKIGSHCAVIVNAADTFWLAADTTGF